LAAGALYLPESRDSDLHLSWSRATGSGQRAAGV
jgi:hypothetical protein